jgi:fructosamine-3-kinase
MNFIKTRNHKNSQQFFCEAQGLAEIAKHYGPKGHKLKTPKVIEVSTDKLILEKIYDGPHTTSFFRNLGRELALMHRCSGSEFGFFEDNFIGITPQLNSSCENWGEFFYKHRLLYQLSLAKKGSEWKKGLDCFKGQLIDFLNSHNPSPSLVHGDLWVGNVLCGAEDCPYVIDPAVYYGDREVDLAMTELFGGFDKSFYQSYEQVYPLDMGYKMRKSIYNIYHLLNHYNTFGASYKGQVESSLELISSFFRP